MRSLRETFNINRVVFWLYSLWSHYGELTITEDLDPNMTQSEVNEFDVINGMFEKLSDEEIVRRQQELYDLETGAMAGRLGTPEEQLQKIKAFFAEIRARKRQEEGQGAGGREQGAGGRRN